MRAIKYFFDEATASLWRGFKTALIATATIAVAFVVLGGFLILTANMERVFTRWQDAAEFSVYLSDAHHPTSGRPSSRRSAQSAVVSALESVSKEDALHRFKQNFATLAEAAGDLPANPLPASIEVRLRPNANPSDVGRARRQSGRVRRAWPTSGTTASGFSGSCMPSTSCARAGLRSRRCWCLRLRSRWPVW